MPKKRGVIPYAWVPLRLAVRGWRDREEVKEGGVK